MLGRTHLLSGVVVFFLMSFLMGVINMPFGLFCFVGSLFPDLDHPKSYMSCIFPIASIPFHFLGHRGFLHSLLAGLLFTGLAWVILYFVHWPLWIALGFLMGFMIHLTFDYFSNSGIPLFWPFYKRRVVFPYRMFTVQTAGIGDRLISFVLFIMILALGFILVRPSLVYYVQYLKTFASS
jgi:inner membrane protein